MLATRAATLLVGDRTPRLAWSLDQDPQWETEGDWAWGVPLGGGGFRVQMRQMGQKKMLF